jgi:SAM-dependent methyltransferase
MSERRSAPPCPACDSLSVEQSRQFRDPEWPIWQCRGCSVQFVWPTPTPATLAGLYSWHAYGRRQVGVSRAQAARLERLRGDLCRELETASGGPGTLVDIGCGDGAFLSIAAERGWEASGIESDPSTARNASERSGVPVRAGDLFDELGRLGTVDAMVMSHTLEHMVDPRRTLAMVHEHLRPDGVLLIRVPNTASVIARFATVKWQWYMPPIHLWYFDHQSLSLLAKKSGFSAILTRTWRGDGLPFGLEIGWAVSRALSQQRAVARPPRSGSREASLYDMYDVFQSVVGTLERAVTVNSIRYDNELMGLFRRSTA